jgi:hypothetical protein
MRTFWWESLRGWDFSRPQLVVVSGLFGGNPSMDGIFSLTEFWLSQSLSHKLFSFFMMEFRLSRSPSLSFFFHEGILAITEPFSRILSFFTMEFRLSQSLSHEFFSFFTMEFRLSRSLSHEFFLFSRWNFGYHGVFLTNSFFFHDGTSAITEPFSRILSFFTMELRLSRSLSHEFFLFS